MIAAAIIVITLLPLMLVSAVEKDPWADLRKQFENRSEEAAETKQITKNEAETEDPWVKLQAIYLPFTEEEETAAATDKIARKKVASGIHANLMPFESIIIEASEKFNVPIEIISGVIMVESGGNPKARAKTSSASGLMQTIAGTFSDARRALAKKGTPIDGSPLDPRASIFAGTWYLGHMYQMAKSDRPKDLTDREDIDDWKYPLEYYYAGPGNGAKREPVVIIYSGGKKVVVDKPAYSNKVLKWARILRAA
jgi:soluble lytic murein transglycosylase-like protein